MPPTSPALVLRFSDATTPASRDRLVALLADHGLVAVHEDHPTDPRTWIAHFADAASRDRAAREVAAHGEYRDVERQPVDVADEDWARRTQADLPSIAVGRVIVAPPWDLPAADASAANRSVLVIIEPSRGFGTGHHQSTRLCLVLLQARALDGKTVVDVGTGSGVLAITAAKLGAAFVDAIDSDADAIDNARENIATNHVETLVRAHVDDLATTGLAPGDLVLANLTGTLLSRHAGDLHRLVRPGGSLIVSGFNVEERERVLGAIAPYFDVGEAAEEDDWHALVLARRS